MGGVSPPPSLPPPPPLLPPPPPQAVRATIALRISTVSRQAVLYFEWSIVPNSFSFCARAMEAAGFNACQRQLMSIMLAVVRTNTVKFGDFVRVVLPRHPSRSINHCATRG